MRATDRPFPRRTRLPAPTYAFPDAAFHVVIRAFPQAAPFHGTLGETTWTLLKGEEDRGHVRLLTACLMPDHLHLVAQPQRRNLVAWIGSFKSLTTHASWRVGCHGA